MFARYDVISSRWSSHFWVKMFFNFFLLKSCKVLIYVLFFHVKYKQLPFPGAHQPFLAVLTWFIILVKIKNGDHCWGRHIFPAAPPPKNIPHLVTKIKGFSLKVKSFWNTATLKNSEKGFHPPPPPPPLYNTTVGVWVCVYVRRLILYYPVFRTCTNFCTIVQQQNDSLVTILLCRHHKWSQMIFVPRKRTDKSLPIRGENP